MSLATDTNVGHKNINVPDFYVGNINSGYHKIKEIVAYRDNYPEKGVQIWHLQTK